ncbi:zinc finger protein 26-like isoform X2 [Rhopalosiphum padi]|nr:zinc finger protein 26-like isoform X2 [Rhopalosiphum padi]XP_060851001.1 zinc finger protein 26-like isoform X2 [Rhopalosiphum padi]
MSLPKKGKGRKRYTTATITTNNKVMSNAMIKLLCYQSSKVSNAKNSSNIQMAQKKITSPKAETSNLTTTMSNTRKTAVVHLQNQSLEASNTNYSRDSQKASRIESKALLERKKCVTNTIGNKFTVNNTVVSGNFFRITTAAMNENNKTMVHSIGDKVGSYVCQMCNKPFKNASSLNEHNKRHKLTENEVQPVSDVIRPHVCNICGLAFRKMSTLTVHYRIHTGQKPFACNVCGDTFTCSANRTVHMRTHTGYRPYVCKFCGFAFNQSHVLTEHVRLHTGERPYECGLCELAFVSSGLLRKHTIRKHNKHA